MDLDFTGSTLGDIGVTVAGIVALSLALQTAAGSTLMYVVEALKRAFPAIDDGKAGLASIILGMVLGSVFGLLTNIVADDGFGELTVAYIATGLIAGLFMGAGAIQNYKAAGTVNPTTDVMHTTNFESFQDFTEEPEELVATRMAFASPREHLSTLKPTKDSGENLESIIEAGPDESDIGCDCTPTKA